MSRGINKVILIGNLGRDPEVSALPNGSSVTNIALATSESWKDKNTGENVERTEWHRIVFFNRLAEVAGQYLNKGSKVYVEGSLRTRKWQDNNGQDRYTTEIIGSEMQMLGNQGDNNTDKAQQYEQMPEANQNKPEKKEDDYNPLGGDKKKPELDDDIPF